ncbi:DUF4132 domain-containing protein [Prosthecodimorpha staleyi]|uniref:DUF4132 domain-containing protein n=1 Tax=Prosthecodimorpha staleyi TaxID=2840188 RepID=A0A947DD21_9HYPH|nr:DUF4132 domain-containing protein [Prosthecodimorpha staleyi]MBT9292994.1 DUF4132 domain-containing protein [Prosthecodimorpha staleyi]
MPSLIDRLLGRAEPETGLDPADLTSLEAFFRAFEPLAGAIPGTDSSLPKRTRRYVLFGEDEAVVGLIWEKFTLRFQMHPFDSGAVLLAVPIVDFLNAPKSWRPEIVFRLARVLDAGFNHNEWWRRYHGGPATPDWLRAYVSSALSASSTLDRAQRRSPWSESLSSGRLRDLCRAAGIDEATILNIVFNGVDPFTPGDDANSFTMAGLPDFIRSRAETMPAHIAALTAPSRASLIGYLGHHGLLNEPALFDLVYAAQQDTAKGVRAAARAALSGADPERLRERIGRALSEGGQKERMTAVETAAAYLKAEAAGLLSRHLEGEKAKPVRAAITSALSVLDAAGGGQAAEETTVRAEGGGSYRGLGGVTVIIPPIVPPEPERPVGAAGRAALKAHLEEWNRELETRRDSSPAAWELCRPGLADDVLRVMDGEPVEGDVGLPVLLASGHVVPKPAVTIRSIFELPDFTLQHLARWWVARGMQGYQAVSWLFSADSRLMAKAPAGADVRTLMPLLPFEPDYPLRALIADGYNFNDLADVQIDRFWPYLAENLAVIDQALGLAAPGQKTALSLDRALVLLSWLPAIPERYLSRLIELGIGDRAPSRSLAQSLLADFAGADPLLRPLVQSPKAEIRARAAAWLAARGDREAVAVIEAALGKEKSEVARAALLTALRRLGGDIGRFMSAEALAREARAGLAQAKPGPDWLRFEVMPPLLWRDGRPIDPDVPRWWTLVAVKLKQPRGNALFDLLLDEMQPQSAAALGVFLLQSFIAEDTRRPTEAEAAAHAEALVDTQLPVYRSWQPEMSRERLYAILKQEKLFQFYGSAIDQKGMLGLAARIPGVTLVQIVKAYLKEFYIRTAQCRALMECVAGNPDPVALQFLLAIANRYRTKGVQQRAAELIDEISAERGWTRDELGDRTAPTGGLDETGLLELPIGDRVYGARLDAGLKLALFNPDGKPVQGLPATADDEAGLAAAKKQLSQARKEIRQVVDLQSQRLYEAFCCERRWPIAEWTGFLLRHPVIGRLVQRLVWLGYDASGAVVAAFRPLDDLTLTDAADTPVDPADFATVGLAHPLHMSPGDAEAWQRHLADYAIEPLFVQFGRPILRTDPAAAQAKTIGDREGHLVDAFTLRGVATKRGYQRGPTGDGGWFTTYEKHFESLKLVVVITFSGNALPEENRTTALMSLSFVPKTDGGSPRYGHPMLLSAVPAALMSEAWNDYHAIAAAGRGFDPAWQTTVQL